MNEIIERVARAICYEDRTCLKREIRLPPCVDSDGKRVPCSASIDQLVLCGIAQAARAAIVAMREPMEAMLGAAREHDEPTMKTVWKTMIDEALKPT